MKKTIRHWFVSATIGCSVLAGVAAFAQTPQVTGTTVTNAEAAEAGTNGQPGTSESEAGIRHQGPMVVFGHDMELKAIEEADAVVVIGGNARVRGKVHGPVVTIWGNSEISSEVQDAAVAVLGGLKLRQGANVHGPTVAVLGDIEAEQGAKLGDGAVAVGGRVEAPEGVQIRGPIQSVDLPKGLKLWFIHCFLKLRPLAPQVGWVWAVAGVFFLLYFLTAALFPRPVQACVAELTNRPATTLFFGLLTKFLAILIISILALTVVGLVVLPFLLAALTLGAIVGKAAFLESIGLKLGRLLPSPVLQKPLLALLVGAAVITLLYLVPVLGALTFLLIGVWGLGGAATAAFGGLRREMPARPAIQAQPQPPPTSGSGLASEASGPVAQSAYQVSSAVGVPPVVSAIGLPDALRYPRGTFWERIAAALLDVVLIGLLSRLAYVGALWPVVALCYFAAMWTWKNTTIGGIVLGLKVTRVDGQPVTFTVALIRSLAAAFSVVVLFLGFLWIAWDPEKQGWHDRIAGTVVVRLPRGTPLVCY
jgi:uncharacterized RDD family membrane protein YckC